MVDFEQEVLGSKFNAAQLKMVRLDSLLTKIAMTDQAPFSLDMITGKYNYELKFNCVNTLMKECIALLPKPDQDKVIKLRDLVKKAINTLQVVIKNNQSGKITFNKENWIKIEETLDIFEIEVRRLLHKTKMDTKVQEEYQGM